MLYQKGIPREYRQLHLTTWNAYVMQLSPHSPHMIETLQINVIEKSEGSNQEIQFQERKKNLIFKYVQKLTAQLYGILKY